MMRLTHTNDKVIKKLDYAMKECLDMLKASIGVSIMICIFTLIFMFFAIMLIQLAFSGGSPIESLVYSAGTTWLILKIIIIFCITFVVGFCTTTFLWSFLNEQ